MLSARAKAGKLGAADAPLVLVCANCAGSPKAALRLTRELGFTDVTVVRGGTAAWAKLGRPLQR
jgi:rhodanese-related sulfurtransferase